jgi:hypothetical protein
MATLTKSRNSTILGQGVPASTGVVPNGHTLAGFPIGALHLASYFGALGWAAEAQQE